MLVLLVGCTTGPAVMSDSDTTVVVSATDDEGMDAQYEGVIAITASGCWGIAERVGATPRDVLWPSGTSLRSDGLHVPSVEDPLEIEDRVVAAGGWVESDLTGAPENPCWNDSTEVFVAWQLERVGP